jgi:hypothetical protein
MVQILAEVIKLAFILRGPRSVGIFGSFFYI